MGKIRFYMTFYRVCVYKNDCILLFTMLNLLHSSKDKDGFRVFRNLFLDYTVIVITIDMFFYGK